MGGEEIAAGDETDDRLRSAAGDDRQAADVLAHHVVGRLAKRQILEDRGRRSRQELGQRAGARRFRIEEIAPREHAEQSSARVDHRNSWWALPGEREEIHARDFIERLSRGERHDGLRACVADEHGIEEIRFVVGRHPHAASRDLLRHDALAHQERGDEERRRASAQQRQEPEGLERRLEGEDDGRQERARCPAKIAAIPTSAAIRTSMPAAGRGGRGPRPGAPRAHLRS